MIFKTKKIIRADMIVGKAYGNCEFVCEMQEFEGEKITIISGYEYLPKRFNYRIKEDAGFYEWNFKMFE